MAFEAVAREFCVTKAGDWSTGYAGKWMRSVEKDLFPWLGSLPSA